VIFRISSVPPALDLAGGPRGAALAATPARRES
jgi:hypothetical protein